LDDFWEYVVNEIQNWEFRLEDILLHLLTGAMLGISLRIKKILHTIKNAIKKIFG